MTTQAIERYPRPELTWDKPLRLHGGVIENPRQFDAFCLYRDLGPQERKAQEVANRIGLHAGVIRRWARTFYWVARVRIYDSDFEKRFRLSMEQKRYEMKERQASLGQMLQRKATDRLGTLKPSDLKAKDVAILAEAGVHIERLGVGEPTDIEESRQIVIQYEGGRPPWSKPGEDEDGVSSPLEESETKP